MRRVVGLLVAGLMVLTGCSDAADATVLSPDQAVTFMAENPDAVLIDVRTPAEIAAGMLVGAVMLDAADPSFDAKASQLDPTATYVLYCRSGNRSAAAATRLRTLGFTNVYDAGAYVALADAGLATT